MRYHGIELEEITEPQIFNPPKTMLVWDNECSKPLERVVCAIAARSMLPVIGLTTDYRHCAEIHKPKNVTHRELARWLAQGKGEMRSDNLTMTFTNLAYDFSMANDPIDEQVIVRKWDDTGWFSPTREYLGLEDK